MENMPIQVGVLDLVLLGALLLFLVRGLVRGIVPELGGALAVLAGVLVSGQRRVHELAAGWFATLLPDRGWADFVAYIGVFLVVFIVALMLFQILERLVTAKAPGWVDRVLGGLAGAVKGLLACTLVLVCLAYAAPESDLRRSSLLAPHFDQFWRRVSDLSDGGINLPRL